MNPQKLNVLVCGSTFGQFWLQAIKQHPQRFNLVGLLGNGSARSRDCARRLNIPCYDRIDSLPDGINLACVVLRAAVMGGDGSELAQQLMAKGISVMQEQPVHHDEVVANLRVARQHNVQYRVGNLYPHLPAVQCFSESVQKLMRRQSPQFIDAACASQVAFPLVSMLAQSLGSLRPWKIEGVSGEPHGPFQLLSGTLGGIPLTLRVHNEVDPQDPDNHFQLLHQIGIGFPAGRLILSDTQGPVLWSPRLHIPQAVKRDFDFNGAESAHLMEHTSAIIGESAGSSWRQTLSEQWPQAIAADLLAFAATPQGSVPASLLMQCQVWQAITQALGYPRLKPDQQFQPLSRSLLPATLSTPPLQEPLLAPFCQRAEAMIAGITAAETACFVERMDHACLQAMVFALQQGKVLDQPGKGCDLHSLFLALDVTPQHQPLIARWLEILVDAGTIRQRGEYYLGIPPLCADDLSLAWQQVHEVWDDRLGSPTFIHYLWQNVEKLGEMMRGQQQAALLLFPEGEMAVADAVYRHTITARYLNTVIADWIMAALASQPAPLRVIEIGAGTGATTERVRETLQQQYGDKPPLRWTFSDVSRFFLLNAGQRYGHLPWMDFTLLDIDQPLSEQGIAPQSQDLLVMAGVLNNANNSENTVRWLAQALVPGGHMLITEPTREHLEILTSQAFMMTPPQDDRQRSGLRFLTPEQWTDLFERAGLEQVACLPANNHRLAPLGQRLFIVRRPH